MIDPVDGMDPFGIIKNFITHPPNPLPFVTPTLIIATHYDDFKGNKLEPPCASNLTSNDRFY
jgi:hypothetical protein